MTPRLLTVLCATLLALPALPSFAQGHAGHGMAAAASAPPLADGEVRKIDKAAGTLTLKHGEIASLGMPPMAMVFAVKDKAWLDRLKVGDKLRFQAANEGGQYVVTAIELPKR